MRTTQKVQSHFYEFFIDRQKTPANLRVVEIDPVTDTKLELIPVQDDWLFPPRLQQLYSHWFCRSENIMVLRGIYYLEKNTVFLLRSGRQLQNGSKCSSSNCLDSSCSSRNSSSSSSNSRISSSGSGNISCTGGIDCTCVLRTIPLHRQAQHWTELSTDKNWNSFKRLKIPIAPIATASPIVATSDLHSRNDNDNVKDQNLEIFSKFESAHLIHVYVLSSSEADVVHGHDHCHHDYLEYHLPRFNLTFRLENGCVYSTEYAGYQLSNNQQLNDTLHGFSRYLVLEKSEVDNSLSKSEFPSRCLLIPSGKVVRSDNNTHVDIFVSVDTDATLESQQINFHSRFGYLVASDITPRLQLAALYAACGTLLPEKLLQGYTGGEFAMDLVRRSWVNHPLSDQQIDLLHQVSSFSEQTPALAILCFELAESSEQLSFLRCLEGREDGVPLPSNRCTAYQRLQKNDRVMNFRQNLTNEEESRTLGFTPEPHHPPWYDHTQNEMIDHIQSSPIPADFVEDVEKTLKMYVNSLNASDAVSNQVQTHFPLSGTTSEDTMVKKHMFSDLKRSWKAHVSLPSLQLANNTDTKDYLVFLQNKTVETCSARQKMQDYLLFLLGDVPLDMQVPVPVSTNSSNDSCNSKHAHASSNHCKQIHRYIFRLFRSANLVPIPTVTDLVKISWLPYEVLRELNPFLLRFTETIREHVLLWMKLCVLEDKLGRCCHYSITHNTSDLVREFHDSRKWDVGKYPQWLAFEVEGGLQIRSDQYTIFLSLTEANVEGAIAHFNMGEGKTRIITPMLLLYWTLKRDGLVRLHILRQLLSEGFSFLHRHICNSVLNRKIMLLPFKRDVCLTPQQAQVCLSALYHCVRVGGCVVVAPEHRLSMMLKCNENILFGNDNFKQSAKVLRLMNSFPSYSLYDESDEILRYKYKLVYAAGSKQGLSSGSVRWDAVQAVLRIIKSNQDVRKFLQVSKEQCIVAWEPTESPESFEEITLIPGPALKTTATKLARLLAIGLFCDPPRQLFWLARQERDDSSCNIDIKNDTMLQFVLGSAKSTIEKIDCSEDRKQHLLILRGLFAHGIICHCLTQRFRIDYGIDTKSGRTRLAVPFTANDTPTEQSEFGQPDIAITKTHLSYYYLGLSEKQLKQSFNTLLELGDISQSSTYNMWFQSSFPASRDPDIAETVNEIGKIDLSNSEQFYVLVKYYRNNMEVINFWLSYCVLPFETTQYPERLIGSPWHLTDTARQAGFSGTNDTNLLLPLQVKPRDTGVQRLLATNGKMLALLMGSTYNTLNLDQNDKMNKTYACWQIVLFRAMEKPNKCDALIDAGGLMKGVTNRQTCDFLLQHLDRGRFKGVVYFDTDVQSHSAHSKWVLRTQDGLQCPLHMSPIRERDAFVYFDQIRCRGADMKLRPQARALVTIHPKICKDDLMQAVGRMRQLDRGQSVVLCGVPIVTHRIREMSNASRSSNANFYANSNPAKVTITAAAGTASVCKHAHGGDGNDNDVHMYDSDYASEPTMAQVMEFVLTNTANEIGKALPEWANQGAHFCTTARACAKDPWVGVMAEVVDLKHMYSESEKEIPIADGVKNIIQFYKDRLKDEHLHEGTSNLNDNKTGCHLNELEMHDGDPSIEAGMSNMLKLIEERGDEYGKDITMKHKGTYDALDEECERELELEEEQEEEVAVKVALQSPISEDDWDYTQIFNCKSPIYLEEITVIPLQTFLVKNLECYQEAGMDDIKYGDSVFVTPNFARSVDSTHLDMYIREVDAVLLFNSAGNSGTTVLSNPTLLLLSEREADAVLQIFWDREQSNRNSLESNVVFLNLSYARDRQVGHPARIEMQLPAFTIIEDVFEAKIEEANAVAAAKQFQRTQAVVRLFNGETVYSKAQKRFLQDDVLSRPRAKIAGQKFVGLRGMSFMFPHSDLENVCLYSV